jgi:hypothetical protein
MRVRLTVTAVARVVLIFIWFVFVVYFGEGDFSSLTCFDFSQHEVPAADFIRLCGFLVFF